MPVYKIADIITEMNPRYGLLESRAKKYLLDGGSPAVEIKAILPHDYIQGQFDSGRFLSVESCEYLTTGALFYRFALRFGSMYLHASAVGYRGRAYLFSAPCGTGKSTHTQNWLKYFGSEAVIINDDKPLIRKINGEYLVYGTPFSGKTNLNENISLPLAGICFLERGENNFIEKMQSEKIFENLFSQTLQPLKREYMDLVLGFCSELIKKIPVYKFTCNMDISSAAAAYEGMTR